MSFDPTWLDLREPADHAARSSDLLNAFCDLMPERARILDLGSGTGSTLRAVAPLLPDASWVLTDNDAALLALAKGRAPDVETVQVDLAAELETVLAREADAVTASALIDLVSAEWLDTLAAHSGGRVIYISLSYDGREAWQPSHADDTVIFEAFQSHQRRDKGFGPALGSEAVPYLADSLGRQGYRVRTAPSPWTVQSGALMQALADGIAHAAVEAGVATDTARSWAAARCQATQCMVGHTDILAEK